MYQDKQEFVEVIKKLKIVNPVIELYRYVLISQLKYQNYNIISKYNPHLHKRDVNNIFVRYVFLQMANNKTTHDPIIPYKGNEIQQLKQDIKSIVKPESVDFVIKKLDLENRCNGTLFKLINNVSHIEKIPWKIIKKKTQSTIAYDLDVDGKVLTKMSDIVDIFNEYKLANYKIRFKKLYISKENYVKLLKRCNLQTKSEFNNILFCLLLRYMTLNINTYGLAIPPYIMDLMNQEFGIQFELFGSPINTYFSNYCSIFHDIEHYFGSYGSFFDMNIKKGNFEANPPFDNEIIKLTIEKLSISLRSTTKPVLIFLVIPGWDLENEYGTYHGLNILMENMELVTTNVKLKKSDHQYYNHEYHKYVNACDTYVCILQNDASKKILDKEIVNKKIKKIINLWISDS